MKQSEEQISKSEFKPLYFQHASPNSGWTQEYWDRFFEYKEGQQYFVHAPEDIHATRMFIRVDRNKHCIYFLSEESEESFFDFPGNG